MRYSFIVFFLLMEFSIGSQIFQDFSSQYNFVYFFDNIDNWGTGCSAFDFNEDGYDDLTLVNNSGQIRIYQNSGQNSFLSPIPISVPVGNMKSVQWVDFDNDNDNDLFLVYKDIGVRLLMNEGDLIFSDITVSSGISTEPSIGFSASWVDINNDGNLDLYVCNYDDIQNFIISPKTNLLYLNLGTGQFQDISQSSGASNGYQQSFQSVWFDYNNDGFLDFSLINDRDQFDDAFYINNGDLTFTDIANTIGLLTPLRSPMSNSISDFDNDGDYDIYKSDFGTAATMTPNDSLVLHSFFINDGNNFNDQIQLLNPNPYYFSWAAVWTDFDNDMYEDLFLATGSLSTQGFDPSLFYQNITGSSLELVNDVPTTSSKSVGATKGDFNLDGKYDLFLLNVESNSRLFINTNLTTNNWIKLTPQGIISNRNAFGTEVIVHSNGVSQRKTLNSTEAMASQYSQNLIFGLGDATIVDSVEVKFLSGIIVKKYDLSVNESYTIDEIESYFIDNFENDSIVFCTNSGLLTASNYSNITWNNGIISDTLFPQVSAPYWFNAVDSNGVMVYSDTIYVSIENGIGLFVEMTNDDCSFADGVELVIVDSVEYSNFSFQWSNGDFGYSIDSVQAGEYYLQALSESGCEYNFGPFVVDFFGDLQISYFTLDEGINDSLTLCVNVYGGAPPFYLTCNSEQIEVLSCVTISDQGAYYLQVQDALGCTVSDSLILENTNSLMTSDDLLGVQIEDRKLIFPVDVEIKDVQITNSVGQKVQTSLLSTTPLTLELQSNLAGSIILVSILTENQVLILRFYLD